MSKSRERVKATNKTKKKTMGGYYASYSRWTTRGKTHAQLKEMVEDMRNCITHQLVRIRKHKYVIKIKQEDKLKERLSNRLKIKSRDKRIEKLKQEKEELKSIIGKKNREIGIKQAMIGSRDLKIKTLTKEKGIISSRLTKRLNKGDTIVTAKPTTEELRLKKMASKPLDERMFNSADLVIKSQNFLKDNDLTMQQLSSLLQIEVIQGAGAADIVGVDKSTVHTLVDRGLVGKDWLGGVKNQRYYFLTQDGTEIVKNFKNYLSYGKGITTT